MGRVMWGDEPAAYRAVIVEEWLPPEGDDEADQTPQRYTHYAGPYGTPGAAKAAITRRRSEHHWYWNGRKTVVEAHVERAVHNWERVE